MRDGAASEAEDESASDPLADLLFTLIAAVLPAILLLAPLTERTTATVQARSAANARAGATLNGVRVRSIIAGQDGVRLGGDDRVIALDQIQDDGGLRGALAEMKRAGEPLVLVVEPEGTESSFLLDPVLATDGPARIEEMRAVERCTPASPPPLSALCAARP